MTSSLDLNLLHVSRQSGSEVADLPDLYAVTPPRKAAHGREEDCLMLYLSMAGNAPLAAEAQTQLLQTLAQKYYKTPGSLTAALRTVAEALNLFLLDRNLRITSAGRQGIGQLILLALRADTLYLAQSGAVHAFLVSQGGTQDLYDLQSSGRGLGLSRTAAMRFLQVKLVPNDYLVLSTYASPGWLGAALAHPQQQGVEGLHRQLVERGSQDFNAVIIQAQPGTGKLRLLKRKADPSAGSQSMLAAQPVGALPPKVPAQGLNSDEFQRADHGLGVSGRTEPAVQSSQDKTPTGLASAALPVQPPNREPQAAAWQSPTASVPLESGFQAPNAAGVTIPPSSGSRGESGGGTSAVPTFTTYAASSSKTQGSLPPSHLENRLAASKGTLAKMGAAILHAFRSAMMTIGEALLRLLKALLPDADVMRLPPSVMVFIALAIPLILATIGGMVFLQRGRLQQAQLYYQQAVDESAYAATLTNPLEQRLAYQTVIGDLNKAEYYTLTSQSQALRAQTVQQLDNLDGVRRLDFKQTIVGGLGADVTVTRLVATATDLYMLNAQGGNVLHAIVTGRGYEIDTSFQCGPTSGPIDIGPLVDITELPPGSFENASLLGMDADGNLLYCVVGSQPYSAALAPPNTGFGQPAAMTLDRSDLFVLDPKVNAVWIYRDLDVREPPRLFFGDEIPPMADVLDLAVYNDDLYLLHSDGHITKCTYSGLAESPTRCEEPYPYSDNRPGRGHGPVVEDTQFDKIYFSSFPERSIYILDPQNQAIYYFSVLLNLQWQYQPSGALADGRATAFAISPNRTAFLAIGNHVYYAAMP